MLALNYMHALQCTLIAEYYTLLFSVLFEKCYCSRKYYIRALDLYVHLWNCWERVVCNTLNTATLVTAEVAHIIVLRVSTGAFCRRKIFSLLWPIRPDSPPCYYNSRQASTKGITYVSEAWFLVDIERMSVKVSYEYPSFLSWSNILQVDGRISNPILFKGF